MNLLLINQILVFLIAIIGVWLSLWVYLTNPKSKINQKFSVMAFFIALWIIFVYFANTIDEGSQSLFFTKLSEITVLFLLLSLYFFIKYFPQELKKNLVLDKIFLLWGIILIFLISFTKLITKDVIKINAWGFSPTPGKLWLLFNAFAFFITISILYFILKTYLKLSPEQKLKVQYFLIGFFIFGITNIIFNIILPLYYQNYHFAQIGSNSAIFLLCFTAYAIVKRKLFDIKVVLTALLVGLIAILLALDTFVFTKQLSLQILKGVILTLFLFFGYLLIKSVLNEIRRREESEKLSRAKSEFISIASHQLRTPMTAISGYLSMLLEGDYGKLSDKMETAIKNVYDSSSRLTKLINDLLNISKVEMGKLGLNLEKTQIENIIDSVVDELKIETGKKNLYLKWQKPETTLSEILIDADKIRQAILNVIDNAIKYTEKGGITIKLKIENLKLKIEIEDTGEGMTKEEQEKLFESFSRGTAGVKLFGAGAGLGLYVAKKFVEMQGGKIWVESEGKSKGSRFYIEFPIATLNKNK